MHVRWGDGRRLTPAFCALLVWLGAVTPVRAGLIDIDVNATGGFGTSGTYSGAAVLGGAGDTWDALVGNFLDSTARPNVPLVTSTGASSGVTLSFSGQTGFFDTGPQGILSSTAYAALMDDYIYVYPPSSVAVSFHGLTPGGTYRLILYSSSDFAYRATLFTVNGSTQTTANPGAVTALVAGLTYADFTTKADAGGQLSFTMAAGSQFGEGNLDGIQLQDIPNPDLGPSVPEPSTFVLSCVVFGVVWSYKRFKRSTRQPGS